MVPQAETETHSDDVAMVRRALCVTMRMFAIVLTLLPTLAFAQEDVV